METKNDKLLEGKKFGKLTIIKYLYTKNRSRYFLCKCDCGNTKEININNIKSGKTKSCGCYNIKKLKERAKTNNYDLTNEYGIGYTSNTNEPFYFDLEDYKKIKKYCWYKDAYGYLVNISDRKNLKLHKLITNTNSNQIIDHINRNKLDNRKSNLRIATHSLNSFNRTYDKEQVGVHWNKEKNKWEAKIMVNYKNIHLGYFNNKQDAIKKRKEAELKYFGEYNHKKIAKERKKKMGFNINDRVEHEIYGKGTIVEIDTDSYLVQFDVPNAHLHNGNGHCTNRYQDNTCYYFDGSQLKLLNEKNIIKPISRIEITPSEITFGFDISKPKAIVLLPERYIINENACILFWENGEKTVVKRCADDEFNPRLAFLTAFFQHYVDMSKNKANKYLASLQVEVKEIKQKPKHMVDETKFKVGDIVKVTEGFDYSKKGWIGKIIKVDCQDSILVKYDDDNEWWIDGGRLKLIRRKNR